MPRPSANKSLAKKRRWTQHAPETKAKAIKLAAEVGPHAAANTLGIPPETVQTWWRVARAQLGHEIPRKRAYTDKFRIAAVELASKHGLAEAARLLEVPAPTLDNWRKRQSHGELRTTRQRYSQATRQRLLELAKMSSTKDAARQLRVRLSTARTWVAEDRQRLDLTRKTHTDDERKAAIELARRTSPGAAARELGIHHKTIKRWCSDAARVEAGLPPRKMASFSLADRQMAVELATSQGLPAALDRFHRKGLSERLLRSWLKKAGVQRPRRKNIRVDVGVEWISQEYPQYSQWQELAAAWLGTIGRGLGHRLAAIRKLIQYLHRFGAPGEPAVFLSRTFPAVNFYTSMCPDSGYGATLNNSVSEFLDWVLLAEFGMDDDLGGRAISPAFRNPVQRKGFTGLAAPTESVYAPLPYGYIAELRKILASGPNFKDWVFATTAMGASTGKNVYASPDWFEVSKDVIDESDPDCVHRIRETPEGKFVAEMWSPVRWVALLTKLILPLRTFQVCVLDSGESDSLLYRGMASGELEQWEENKSLLCTLPRGRRSWNQGVFRRTTAQEVGGTISSSDEFLTVLYINTNKTADMGMEGPAKGYIMPWIADEDVSSNIFYWFEKLRNWQTKYNPLERRTSWSELRANHISPKTAQQLATYPDACFLFRFAEAKERADRRLPLSRELLDTVWYMTLSELERRISARGETAGGQPVQLVNQATKRALFPMHSLRVSLITSLALDGKLSLVVLQKLVGHSRLLMTLYYVVAGKTRTVQELREATKRMKEGSNESIITFLTQATHERLQGEAIFNDSASALLTLPKHPASRNPAGWMKLHHGACLVGGNTSPLQSESKVGGCFNGGPNAGTPSKPRHGPVPGGTYNCVRCRWFVTTAAYVEALVAHFNVLMYHFSEAEAKWTGCDEALKALLTRRVQAEEQASPFVEQELLKDAERRVQASIGKLLGLASDLDATLTLVERCVAAMNRGSGDSALIAVGQATDVKVAIEKVSSELLAIAVACQAVEVYPDEEPGTAVIRQSQLLDAAMMREGLRPFLLQLPLPQQLKFGNAFMRSIAVTCRPDNEQEGLREITSLIEARAALGRFLNADFRKSFEMTVGHVVRFDALTGLSQ